MRQVNGTTKRLADRGRHAAAGLAVVLALAGGLAGCGGDDGPDVPTGTPAVVDDLRATAAAAGSITLAWTAPGLVAGTGTGAVTAYDLRAVAFGQENAPFATWPAVAPVPSPGLPGTPQQAVCEGLAAGQAYVLRLRSTCDGQTWSDLSNVVVASADPRLDLTPPAAVTGLALRWRTATQCEVEWSVTGDDGGYGEADAYEARYATAPIDAQTWDDATPAGAVRPGSAVGRLRAAATDLDPAQTYHFAVRATDDAGNVALPCPALAVAPSDGAVLRVAADGSGDLPTIGAALTAAGHGDVVLVGPGRYTWTSESGGMNPLAMFYFYVDVTGITLISEDGPEATILDAEQQGRVIFAMAHNDDVVIDGFTITGGVPTPADGETPKAGGLLFHLTNLTVRNCIFTGNRGGQGGAIYFGGRGHPLIENCVITGNHADEVGGGIFLINSPGQGGTAVDAPTVRGCTITDNTADRGGGLYAYDIVAHIEDCLIANNRAVEAGGGVLVAGYGIPEQPLVGVEMVRCTIAGNHAPNGAGLRLATSVQWGEPEPGNLTVTSCIFADNHGGAQIAMSEANLLSIGCSVISADPPGNTWPAGCTDAGGNLAIDPGFCAPDDGDYGLREDSPCAPGRHPDGDDCGRIGARAVGCGQSGPVR